MLIFWTKNKNKKSQKSQHSSPKIIESKEEKKVSIPDFEPLSKCPQSGQPTTTESNLTLNLDNLSINKNEGSFVDGCDSVIFKFVNTPKEKSTQDSPNIQDSGNLLENKNPLTKEQIANKYREILYNMFLCPDVNSAPHKENYKKAITGIYYYKDNQEIYNAICEILHHYFFEIISYKGDGIVFFEQIIGIIGMKRFILEYYEVISKNINKLLLIQKGCTFLIKMISTQDKSIITFLTNYLLNNFIFYSTGDFSSDVICYLYSLNNPVIISQFNQALNTNYAKIYFNYNAQKVLTRAMECKVN